MLVAADRLADLIDLVDVAREGPEVGVVGAIALTGLELVVMIIFNALRREIAVHHVEIGVREARPASQEQELQVRVVADPLDPYLVRAFWGRNRDLASAAAPCIRVAAVVVVGSRRGARMGMIANRLLAAEKQQRSRACG